MLSPCIPVSDNSHDVIVVPILAPIITPIACDSLIIPEFTKPTTITVVADDDWITAVTKAPSMMALKGLEVIFREFAQGGFPIAFKALSHCIHTEQEQRKSSDHSQNAENIHSFPFQTCLLLIFCFAVGYAASVFFCSYSESVLLCRYIFVTAILQPDYSFFT